MANINSPQKPNSNRGTGKRRTLLIAGIIILVLVGVLVALEMTDTTSFFHADNKPSAAETEANNNKKEAVVNNGGTPISEGKEGTPSGDYIPPTSDEGITLTPSIFENDVIVSTQLKGYSDGTCTLSVTNGAKNTSQTAQVIYAPSFSSCAGFSVPKSTLGSGTWNITVSVLSGGNTTSKTVTYEVQ